MTRTFIRSVTLSVEEQENFDPASFTVRLLKAGFEFDHLGITQPWARVKNDNGTVTYKQWFDGYVT